MNEHRENITFKFRNFSFAREEEIFQKTVDKKAGVSRFICTYCFLTYLCVEK